MKTLETLVKETKCRKGSADGTTKRGAYWLATDTIKIRSYGGDGIGNSSPDEDHYLQLRHYRSGEVSAVIHYHSWHQNEGDTNLYASVDLNDCGTVEDVIVALKARSINGTHAYSDYFKDDLTATLESLGMPESAPAPDEDDAIAAQPAE